MPIQVKYFDNAGAEIDSPDDGNDSSAFTAVVDGDKPLVVFSAGSDNGADIPPRPKLADLSGVDPDPDPRRMIAVGDALRTMEIVAYGIKNTRRVLTGGPLNNSMPAYDDPSPPGVAGSYTHPTIPPRYVCQPLSPNYLNSIGESFEYGLVWDPSDEDNWKHRGQFAHLLARFYRGVFAQAGVCATIGSVSAGLMSMSAHVNAGATMNDIATPPARPYLSIVNISHNENHNFNIVSYGRSPWFVCDPWVAEPYVVEFDKNWCDPSGVDVWSEIRIYADLEDPFGLPLMNKWKDDHLDDSNAVEGLLLTPDVIRTKCGEYERNLPPRGFSMIPEGAELFDNPPNWYPNLETGRCLRPGETTAITAKTFHPQSGYQMLTTHPEGCNKYTDAQWLEYRKQNEPVVRGDEWGTLVTDFYPEYGEHQADEEVAAE